MAENAVITALRASSPEALASPSGPTALAYPWMSANSGQLVLPVRSTQSSTPFWSNRPTPSHASFQTNNGLPFIRPGFLSPGSTFRPSSGKSFLPPDIPDVADPYTDTPIWTPPEETQPVDVQPQKTFDDFVSEYQPDIERFSREYLFRPIADEFIQPLKQQVSQIGKRVDDVASKPDFEFDYTRLPNIDLSGLDQRLAAIENKPAPIVNVPDFDYSRIPNIDLSGLDQRLAAIESRRTPDFDYSRIPNIDMSGIEQRLAAIENRSMPEFEPTDLSGIYSRFNELESRIGNMPAPTVNVPSVNFAPIDAQISALRSELSGLRSMMPAAPDFGPLEQRLAAIEARPMPTYQAPDLSGIYNQLAAIDQRIASIPTPQAPDIGAFENSLGSLESRLMAQIEQALATQGELSPQFFSEMY